MNITPEQIPDEAARAALEKYYRMTGIKADSCIPHMKEALAAALPVLLGEPVGWMRRNITYKDTDGRRDGERILSERKVFCDDISLYTLPTPETPNDHP
jgi:hypothetical protein